MLGRTGVAYERRDRMLRTAARILGGVALLVLLAIVFTPLAALVSSWLSRSGPLERADAIVVLGGGGVREDGDLTDVSLRRTHHGVRLFRNGLAPLLVLSGPAEAGGPAEAAVRARFAESCGIPNDAVLLETAARTTREEARNIARTLLPRGVRTILLVGDAEGMARARRLFDVAGFTVIPAPSADVAGGRTEDRLAVARRVAMELTAWLYYAVAGYF
jgi:uncharacterized SAM-binding protein YcdF (DUF218 family)